MLRETFIGKKPTLFILNPIVKRFIISETFVWSAMNFITPIFAVFAATQVTGGSISIAATGFSVYLVIRVVSELIIGELADNYSNRRRMRIIIIGTCLLTIGYIGFMFTTTVYQVYLFYAIKGIGMGIATPIKNMIFSTHLDKNRESSEWGMHDAAIFLGMALAAAVGGFIAEEYGFRIVFLIAAFINTLGIIPFVLMSPKVFQLKTEKKIN
ncbi:MAG TPA: MFS transporter [Candidatus Levybacteria bacterium]|nr:MFS transporter [Candidatus Levybacteria bacterium]